MPQVSHIYDDARLSLPSPYGRVLLRGTLLHSWNGTRTGSYGAARAAYSSEVFRGEAHAEADEDDAEHPLLPPLHRRPSQDRRDASEERGVEGQPGQT